MSLLEEKIALIARSTLLVDTNLQLLEIVGNLDVRLISQHKRISNEFDLSDFELLQTLVEVSNKRVTLPNILTEVSNLLSQGLKHYRGPLFQQFTYQIQQHQEEYVSSKSVVEELAFAKLGLTDAAMIKLEIPDLLILTVDIDLCIELSANQVEHVNMNHLRDY